MNNLELIEWIKLWMPELNSFQISKLRDKFAEAEREARIKELELAVQQFIFNTKSNPNNFSEYATHRAAELKGKK